MTSLTVENYLKTAWQISARQETPWVTTGQLATALQVSPGTVTSMLKTLAESGLAEYRPYEGASLTTHGKTLALRMLRRHRLIELFLARTLQLRWDQVHEEAEHMEHAVSDFLVDRIDEYLGLPTHDPHGDPIPSSDGQMRGDTTASKPLASIAAGERVRLTRVTNQGREFLQFLTDSAMQLGSVGIVHQNNVEAGIMVVEVQGRSVAIGLPAAQQILVELMPHDTGAED
jgi:DtxR family Mn-dependent transcriptional regulator